MPRFDFLIVITSLLDVISSHLLGTSSGGVTALRAFRALRILKLLREWKSLQAGDATSKDALGLGMCEWKSLLARDATSRDALGLGMREWKSLQAYRTESRR